MFTSSIKRLLITALALLCSGTALADCERGMGPGMMGGPGGHYYGHMGGLWFIGFGLYALLCVAAVLVFFWLMFRITWALEDIAKAKKKEA